MVRRLLHVNSPAGCRSLKFSDKWPAVLILPLLHETCVRENAAPKTRAYGGLIAGFSRSKWFRSDICAFRRFVSLAGTGQGHGYLYIYRSGDNAFTGSLLFGLQHSYAKMEITETGRSFCILPYIHRK